MQRAARSWHTAITFACVILLHAFIPLTFECNKHYEPTTQELGSWSNLHFSMCSVPIPSPFLFLLEKPFRNLFILFFFNAQIKQHTCVSFYFGAYIHSCPYITVNYIHSCHLWTLRSLLCRELFWTHTFFSGVPVKRFLLGMYLEVELLSYIICAKLFSTVVVHLFLLEALFKSSRETRSSPTLGIAKLFAPIQ